MITIKQLNKYFNRGKKNELHVLNGINITFEEKGLVCILGESGSGKTTLLNTIGGLDTFADGEMEIDGQILKRYIQKETERLRNDKFGYIFQNYYLLQDYTVAYNIKLALNTFDISEEEREQRVDYVLEKLDMAKYKKKLVSQLSGGQQQRVSIARALVKSPKIILADEPTGNLDEENTLRTMSILKNIAKDCLVILVSHEKRIAQFFAERIIEIEDGKIQKDYINKNQSAYQRMDDGNIYLKDMDCINLNHTENTEVNLYQNEEDKGKKICLNMAWKGGKLYIQNLSDCDVLLAGQETGCEMFDTSKPDVKMEEVENFEFSLPTLKNHKTASLGFREIRRMALENIRLMGKKQAFIIGILLATAVLLTITLANFTNSFFYNRLEVQTTDSHYISVSAEPAYNVYEWDFDEAFQNFCEKYVFQGKYSDIYRTAGSNLTLRYHGFMQLTAANAGFTDFSFLSPDHVSEKDLICGHLPEKSNEIVADRWLFDRFLASDSPFKILYSDAEDFLNEVLESKVTGDSFRIVGICDKGEPGIYMSQNKAMGLAINSYRIASLDELRAEYPEKYDDISLKDGEILANLSMKEEYERLKLDSITMKNGREYTITGYFPEELNVDYVLNDADCLTIRNDYIVFSKNYDLYTEHPEQAIKDLKKYAKQPEYANFFTLKAVSQQQEQIKTFEEARKESVSSRNLIAIAAAFLALFAIYFTIKSNVSSRMEELTVYRLIGISGKSIIHAYLLEMVLITSYTVLPAVLVTSGLLHFISSVPSLELHLNFPWWAAFLLIAVLYLLNVLISILPIRNILSQPPAKLAAKS